MVSLFTTLAKANGSKILNQHQNDNCYPSRLKIPQIPVEPYWQDTYRPFQSIHFAYQSRCIPVTTTNGYGIFKIYRDLPVSELSHSAEDFSTSSPRSLSLLIPAMLAFAWNGSCRNVSWIWTGWLRGCEVFLLSNMFNSTSSLFVRRIEINTTTYWALTVICSQIPWSKSANFKEWIKTSFFLFSIRRFPTFRRCLGFQIFPGRQRQSSCTQEGRRRWCLMGHSGRGKR